MRLSVRPLAASEPGKRAFRLVNGGNPADRVDGSPREIEMCCARNGSMAERSNGLADRACAARARYATPADVAASDRREPERNSLSGTAKAAATAMATNSHKHSTRMTTEGLVVGPRCD
jgi:hypothetical protein